MMLILGQGLEPQVVVLKPFHPSIHFIIRLIPTRVQLQVPRISYLALCLDDMGRDSLDPPLGLTT
jgi:hypothetical protein